MKKVFFAVATMLVALTMMSCGGKKSCFCRMEKDGSYYGEDEYFYGTDDAGPVYSQIKNCAELQAQFNKENNSDTWKCQKKEFSNEAQNFDPLNPGGFDF